ERLDRHPEPAGEADRVGQVPAVQTEPQLAVVELVRGDHLRHAQVGRAVGLVPGPVRVLEGPGPAEVVLGAGAADGGEVLVVVEVELDLPLARPAGVVGLPGEVGAPYVPVCVHSGAGGVRVPVGRRVGSALLGVQVVVPGADHGDAVGDLVVVAFEGLLAGVLDGDPRVTGEGHLQVGG